MAKLCCPCLFIFSYQKGGRDNCQPDNILLNTFRRFSSASGWSLAIFTGSASFRKRGSGSASFRKRGSGSASYRTRGSGSASFRKRGSLSFRKRGSGSASKHDFISPHCFRYPDLGSHHELKAVDHCQYAFHLRSVLPSTYIRSVMPFSWCQLCLPVEVSYGSFKICHAFHLRSVMPSIKLCYAFHFRSVMPSFKICYAFHLRSVMPSNWGQLCLPSQDSVTFHLCYALQLRSAMPFVYPGELNRKRRQGSRIRFKKK